MNISSAIKKQRNKLSLSQEELAEKLYVTRHTIGNWENNKSYPDIHSLILLSQIFDMTVDNLIKGDLEMMEQTVKAIETKHVKQMKVCNIGMIAGLVTGIILLPLSWLLNSGLISTVAASAYLVSLCFLLRMAMIQYKYDIGAYEEILAFSNGAALDEIQMIRKTKKGIAVHRVFPYLLGFLAFASLIGTVALYVLLPI